MLSGALVVAIAVHGIQLLGETGNDVVFNTAVIRSTEDVEKALVSPVRVPRVRDCPIRSSIGPHTPTNDLNGMATQLLARCVLVHTRLVCQKVLIHSEGSGDGSIGEDIGLDGRHISRELVGGSTEVLGIGPRFSVLASRRACRSWVFVRWARTDGSIHVVIARGERVRVAATTVVIATINEAGVNIVLPSCSWVTTIATHTAAGAAGVHVLGGEVHGVGTIGSNADTIGNGFGRAESPA